MLNVSGRCHLFGSPYGPSHQLRILRYCFCDKSLCLEADATDTVTETRAIEKQRSGKTKESIHLIRM